MADSDHRWHRDLASGQDTKSLRGGQADDPLAELARLIGQTVPMSREASAAPASNTVSREPDEPAPSGYAAPDDEVEKLAADRYSSRARSATTRISPRNTTVGTPMSPPCRPPAINMRASIIRKAPSCRRGRPTQIITTTTNTVKSHTIRRTIKLIARTARIRVHAAEAASTSWQRYSL